MNIRATKGWQSLCLAFLLASTAASAVAQGEQGAVDAPRTPAKLEKVHRYADGSCGGILVDATGRTPFHLSLTRHRCDLFVGATHESDAGAKRLAPGGDAETAFVARLVAWSEASFPPAERAEIEGRDDVHHRGSGWTFDRYKEAAVVNRLAHYRQIRGATIGHVFLGRGTVALSFKVRDGLGATQLVLFRKLDDGTCRPHLGDSVEPVAEESRAERWILQAMLSYSQRHVPQNLRDLLWSGVKVKAKDVTPEAMNIVSMMIAYRNATAPRIVGVRYLRDGGSVVYVLVDARGAQSSVKFDKQIGSDTIGRMKYSDATCPEQLVAFGSQREKALLAGFDGWLARGGSDPRGVLASALARYRDLAEDASGKGKR